MPVDNKSSVYNKWLTRWKKNRDFLEGEDEVKDSGNREVYLPNFFKKNENDKTQDKVYQNFLLRAYFLEAVQKTMELFSGMIFKNKPQLKKMDKFPNINDVDGCNTTLNSFVKNLTNETILNNMSAVLVDFTDTEGNQITEAEKIKINARVVWKTYNAENIINVKFSNFNNLNTVSLVVLMESYQKESTDKFSNEYGIQYRVLGLDEEGYYYQELYQDKNLKISIFEGENGRIYPMKNGSKFNFIPVYFTNNFNNQYEIKKSIISPIVNICAHFYLDSGDYNWGKHFSALPTPWVAGATEEEIKKLTCIGPTQLWGFGNPSAKAGMLEFNGQGLNSFVVALNDYKDDIASMGVKALGKNKKVAESAEKVKLDSLSEIATLSNISLQVSETMLKIIKLTMEWENIAIEKDIDYILNQDFLPKTVDANLLNALVSAVVQGKMTLEIFFENLKKMEIVNSESEFEEFQDSLIVEGNGDID
jgi:hypothetical protein